MKRNKVILRIVVTLAAVLAITFGWDELKRSTSSGN